MSVIKKQKKKGFDIHLICIANTNEIFTIKSPYNSTINY